MTATARATNATAAEVPPAASATPKRIAAEIPAASVPAASPPRCETRTRGTAASGNPAAPASGTVRNAVKKSADRLEASGISKRGREGFAPPPGEETSADAGSAVMAETGTSA
jgi:hypothetical protein